MRLLAPYRRFAAATHQTCFAHLPRRARTLRGDHPRRAAADIQTALKQTFSLRGEARGRLRPIGVDEAFAALAGRLAPTAVRPGPSPAVQRFASASCTIFGKVRLPRFKLNRCRLDIQIFQI